MPPTFPDIRTLLAVLMLVSFILGIMMLLIWSKQKTYPGFGFWTGGSCLSALGFLLVILRGAIPDFFSIILSNAFLMISATLYLSGARRFRDVPSREKLDLFVVSATLLAIIFYTYANYNLPMRIAIFSLCTALFFGLSAWELMRNPPPRLRFSFVFTGSLFSVASIVMIGRAGVTILAPPYRDIFESSVMQGVTYLLPTLLGILWTFGFLILNSERMEMDLTQAQSSLRHLATTDFLTGIDNSRSFMEKGEQEIHRARRYDRSLAALMVDLDHFKQTNDTYGHAVGDKTLAAVADTFRSLLRDIDIYGRLGGEEFAILLPEADLDGAVTTAERLRLAVAEMVIPDGPSTLNVTVSIGVAVLSEKDGALEALLKRADEGMYEAKRQGRNRVVTAACLPASGS